MMMNSVVRSSGLFGSDLGIPCLLGVCFYFILFYFFVHYVDDGT